jgi:peroxiredoxin
MTFAPRSALRVGDPAPEFELPGLDGGSISLRSAREAASSVLLIFLRHLG